MGKVWLKTRYDNGMKMDIPHSLNIANAMYGFRELGAEIIPYHFLDEIYSNVTREDIVLDYISQCNAIFKKFGVIPNMPDYPSEFEQFFGRKIWHDTIDSISCDEAKWSAGNFVKPVQDKVFTGKVIRSLADLIGCGKCGENYEVLVSEPLNIKAEWRCFLMYGQIADIKPYGQMLGMSEESYFYHYDTNVVKEMLKTFQNWKECPAACSMDICVTEDARTLLVEFNDAYALGAYGLSSITYAKLISARWSQLLNREDVYHFS